MTKPTWISTFPMLHLHPIGLKALIYSSSESEFRCLTRTYTFAYSQFLSPSSDEKGKEIEEEEEEEEVEYLSRRQKWRNEWRKREFPPPLPVVVKTEKDSARQDHVPWVLKKYSYGDNGRDEGGGNRVVVIEERVKHRKYFRAHRSNGHLTLQLICVDDEEDANVKGDETPRVGTENVEQEFYETDETEEAEIMEKEFEPDQDDEMGDINPTVEASWMQGSSMESKSNGGVAKGKCWTVSGSVGRRSNSDLFRMAIPSMRPIHG